MLTRREFLVHSLAATALSPPAPFTDAHVHVFRRDPATPYAEGAHPPSEDFPVEALLALMRENAVAHAVLVQVIHYRWDNRYLASILKQYPGTFQAVCRVDPQDPKAPDQLSELTRQGFRGVRLSPAATPEGDWIRGPLMRPLWQRCAQLAVPMTILTTPPRLPDLIPLIEGNPSLEVVIDHMAECPLGDPAQLKLLLALARYPRVSLKISGLWTVSKQPYPYPDAQQQLARIRDAFSAKRLMAATNWPVSLSQVTYARAVALERKQLTIFNDVETGQILTETASKLWQFD